MNKYIAILFLVLIAGSFYLGFTISEPTQVTVRDTVTAQVDSQAIVQSAREGFVEGTYKELKRRFAKTYKDTQIAWQDSIRFTDSTKTDTVYKVKTLKTEEKKRVKLKTQKATCQFDFYQTITSYGEPVNSIGTNKKFYNPTITYQQNATQWYNKPAWRMVEIFTAIGIGFYIGNNINEGDIK